MLSPLWEWNRYLVPLIILNVMSIFKIYINFLKTCIWKHFLFELARDEVYFIRMVCAAYNFVPNRHFEWEFFLMFRRDAFTPLLQLLNPKLRQIGYDKSLFALDAFQDLYALTTHNIKLSREGLADKLLTYPIPEFNGGDKVIVRNHTRHVWDPKCDVTYRVVWVLGRKMELMDKSCNNHKVNVQDVKICTQSVKW